MTLQASEIIGDGVSIGYSTDGTTYTPFAKVTDIDSNKLTVPEIKTGVLGDAAQKSQPGTPDYGELAVTLTYSKAITTLVNGWAAAKTILYFQITIVEGGSNSVSVYQGWVKEFEKFGTAKKDEKLDGKLTIKITGAETFTAAT